MKFSTMHTSPIGLLKQLARRSKRFTAFVRAANDYMVRFQSRWRMWFHSGLNLIHGGRAVHVVLCGSSRSGTTRLYNMMRYSAGVTVFAPPRENPARRSGGIFARNILTKRPLDILETESIIEDIGRFRDLRFVVLRRDPRDLVSSIHRSVPNQFFQGADYQFFVSGSVRSLSKPGIAACHQAIKRLDERGNGNIIHLRYEDLTSNPELVRAELRAETGLRFGKPFAEFERIPVPPDLQAPLNGIRPVEHSVRPAWCTSNRLQRACRQVRLFPELEEIAADWGYGRLEEILDRFGIPIPELQEPRGTIVAFHTDDELYRAEADRFLRSLERLGLPYDLTIVPPRDSWVANCAMKPEIMADARRRLRGPLLYLDVDAFVHRDPWPYLAQYDGDLAAHIDPYGVLNSATLWINDTDGASSILELWKQEIKLNEHIWDQEILRSIVDKSELPYNSELNIQRLPLNMAKIFDKNGIYIYGEVFIEQLQASRASELKWGGAAKKNSKSRERRLAEIDRIH